MLRLPREEYLLPGNASCPGCGAAIALRHVLKALGGRTVFCIPACCTSVIQGLYPRSSFAISVLNIAFAAAAAAASGMAAALEVLGREDVVPVVWAGDGGTYDIGIQALSGAVERGDNLLYICYDNQAYMNTGIQRSGATPVGAWTTTTPTGKREPRKPLELIMLLHGARYVATACPSYPLDLYEKVKKAAKIKGPRFILCLAPCPTGWRYPPNKTVEVGRLAVETLVWPLWEFDGEFRFTGPTKALAKGKLKPKPVKEWLKVQGRFRGALKNPEFVKAFEGEVKARWELLLRVAEVFGWKGKNSS